MSRPKSSGECFSIAVCVHECKPTSCPASTIARTSDGSDSASVPTMKAVPTTPRSCNQVNTRSTLSLTLYCCSLLVRMSSTSIVNDIFCGTSTDYRFMAYEDVNISMGLGKTEAFAQCGIAQRMRRGSLSDNALRQQHHNVCALGVA